MDLVLWYVCVCEIYVWIIHVWVFYVCMTVSAGWISSKWNVWLRVCMSNLIDACQAAPRVVLPVGTPVSILPPPWRRQFLRTVPVLSTFKWQLIVCFCISLFTGEVERFSSLLALYFLYIQEGIFCILCQFFCREITFWLIF